MKWVIWSVEHCMWWKPNSYGYTADLLSAGIYEEDEAKAIVDKANFVDPNQEWCAPVDAVIALATLVRVGTVGTVLHELFEGVSREKFFFEGGKSTAKRYTGDGGDRPSELADSGVGRRDRTPANDAQGSEPEKG